MKRIIEIVALIGNHNLYHDDRLVIDWSDLVPIGKKEEEIVALCYDATLGFAWVESATIEECEEVMSFYEFN